MDITIIDLINRIDYNTISDQRKDLPVTRLSVT